MEINAWLRVLMRRLDIWSSNSHPSLPPCVVWNGYLTFLTLFAYPSTLEKRIANLLSSSKLLILERIKVSARGARRVLMGTMRLAYL